MGVVYSVEDPRLKRRAALKLLFTPYKEEDAERFMREAVLTAALDHPAIPPVYDAGRNADGEYFILMRLISGVTLEEASRAQRSGESGALNLAELLEALIKVAEAVAHAASRGCIHRDLKPSNIMIGEYGEVLIMDWGLGRRTQDDTEIDSRLLSQWGHLDDDLKKSGLTVAGSIVGTPGFMPPEQASSQKVDSRADIFGLGAILHYILTGRAPVNGDNALNKIMNTIQGSIDHPTDLNPEIPNELNWIAANALAADPNYRTVSAVLFAKQLKQYLSKEAIELYPYSLREKLQRWSQSQFNLLTISFAFILIVSCAFFFINKSQKRANVVEKKLTSANDQLRILEAKALVAAQLKAKESSQNAEFLFLEAKIAIKDGQPRSETIDKIDRAFQSSDQLAKDYLYAAALYKLAGMTSISKKTLLKGHSHHPKNLEILFRLHELKLIETTNLEGELKTTPWLTKLLEVSAESKIDNEFTYFMKARTFMVDKEYARALVYYNKAEQSYELLHNIYLFRGECHAFLGQYGEAFADFKQSLSINPKSIATNKRRGDLHFELKNDSAAVSDYKQVLSVLPDNADLSFRLGNLYLRMTQYQRALECYEQALTHKDKLGKGDFSVSEIHTRKALVYAKKKLGSKAIEELSHALKYDRENPVRYRNLGKYSEKFGKFSMAATIYSNAINRFPKEAELYRDRARAFQALSKFDERNKDLRTYLRLKPDAPNTATLRQIIKNRDR